MIAASNTDLEHNKRELYHTLQRLFVAAKADGQLYGTSTEPGRESTAYLIAGGSLVIRCESWNFKHGEYTKHRFSLRNAEEV